MKILLIGEYSNLHNSLKQGLLKNNHEVVLVGSGDGFKKYDVDILIKSTIFENKYLKIIAKIIDKVFKFKAGGWDTTLRNVLCFELDSKVIRTLLIMSHKRRQDSRTYTKLSNFITLVNTLF